MSGRGNPGLVVRNNFSVHGNLNSSNLGVPNASMSVKLDNAMAICEENQRQIKQLKDILANQFEHVTATYDLLNNFHHHFVVWRQELTSVLTVPTSQLDTSFNDVKTYVAEKMARACDSLLDNFEVLRIIR